MAGCLFSEDMPTTANRSVWNVVMGTVRAYTSQGKIGFDVIDEVVQVVIDKSEGLAWGDSVQITGEDPNSLETALFNILEGKTIKLPNGGLQTIIERSNLNLVNNTNDRLEYYDPGLYPVNFGENPEDVFDMEE